MSIIVELILWAIMIFGVAFGIKKGLIMTISKPLKPILSFYVAFSFCSKFGNKFIKPIIYEPMTAKITDYLTKKCADITAATAEKKLPTLLKLAAGVVGVDVSKIEHISSEAYISTLVDKLASPAISIVAAVIGFFILYLLGRIVFSILFSLVDNFFNTGVIGVTNRILGCIVSTMFAFSISWALVMVFDYVLMSRLAAGDAWATGFEGGIMYKLFKQLSPLDILLSF